MNRYIKFEEPNFTYEKVTNPKTKSFFLSLVETVVSNLPKSNPDFEDIYQNVKYWLVELGDDGKASREVGLNKNQEPIAIGPFRNNRGFWTDSNLNYDQIDNCFFKNDTILESEFEHHWDNFPTT